MPEIFEELDRQADKWGPTAAAISLGSLGLGAGISTTAVGTPIGGIIAGVGQLPSLVIDGYQAGRGWYKTFKESPSNFGNAVWNTLETGADILGAKFATALTKGVRPSQGSYFTSKLNQELNRSYLEVAKIQLPIYIIPNIIDIHETNKRL